MRYVNKSLVAAVLGLFSLVGSVEAGYFTPSGTYLVTQGDTVEQVVRDMGAGSASNVQLVSSPGRRHLEGKTLQRILNEGHILWTNDEYVKIR